MCNGNTNYLLEGDNQAWIASKLCAFNNNQLAAFFTFISAEMDFSQVKNTVYSSTPMSDLSFIMSALGTVEAVFTLQNVT
jgi:hypothetical protein